VGRAPSDRQQTCMECGMVATAQQAKIRELVRAAAGLFDDVMDFKIRADRQPGAVQR